MKQWVQRDTANQLSRERTEINKIIDSKGYVKNTEFSNKFNESARGITNQLSALETYKNQDGVRVANMQIWAQNNTANQLTAARRSIESWVNEKGYATNSVVENKVRETANSFSRDLSNATNSINTLNSWKQTATETLNTVSSGLNDAVKHSQLRVGADKIDFGSNQVFDGRNLASMLSVSPESIQAITNKLIITPANENLIKPEYRRNSSFTNDIQISEKFDIGKTKDFLIKGKARTNSYENRFRFAIKIIYKDGSNDFVTGIDSARYINGGEFSIPFKINERNKEINNAYFTIDRYGTPIFDELSIVPQKSAELIVDGSIEGRHVKAKTLETGHHKAGSITSDIIAANAVRAKHVLIDDGLINNLITHNAFINKLWAQQAFINKLNAINFDFTKGSGDYIQSKNGNMKWDLNNNSMILKSNASIEFKESGNVLFRKFNNQTAFLNFVNDTSNSHSSVVLGGNRGGSFDPNSEEFVGMRIFTRTDTISFLADYMNVSGGVGEKNGFNIDVLKSQIRPVNGKTSDIYIGSKNGQIYSLRHLLANIIYNIDLLHRYKTTNIAYSYDYAVTFGNIEI